MPERVCNVCGGVYYSKGLCNKHYLNQLRASKPKKVSLVKSGVKCYASSCDRNPIATGLCQAHYVQKLDGRPFRPIQVKIIEHKDDFGRVCTECFKYKTWKNFYKSSDLQGYRAKCKECTIRKNTIWNRKRTRK